MRFRTPSAHLLFLLYERKDVSAWESEGRIWHSNMHQEYTFLILKPKQLFFCGTCVQETKNLERKGRTWRVRKHASRIRSRRYTERTRQKWNVQREPREEIPRKDNPDGVKRGRMKRFRRFERFRNFKGNFKRFSNRPLQVSLKIGL